MTKEGCLSAQHQEIHVHVKLAEQSKIGVRKVWITFPEKSDKSNY